MVYKVIIIGAGPAGLFAAQMIGEKKRNVLLLEGNNKVGKKLLVSGSGQCNYTHCGSLEDFLTCYGDHSKFIKPALKAFDNERCIAFFKANGVLHDRQENGKVFPLTRKSKDILQVLLNRCQRFNVEIKCNEKVTTLSTCDGLFIVETEKDKRYVAENVVISTGGKSYPVLGTDGSGYDLAKQLGHTIIHPRPALTHVIIEEPQWAQLSGISFENITMHIMRANKKIATHTGSLLFTHKGLSGPLILDATRWIKAGDTLEINFLAPHTEEVLRKKFIQEIPLSGKLSISSYLKPFNLPKNFLKVVLELLKIDPSTPCAKITKEQRNHLLFALTRGRYTIKAVGDFRCAMVTAGGVHLKEINPTTMESRKQKGLYFAGEVVDIDGNTGGYNIQAAFSMGYVCAKHLREKL